MNAIERCYELLVAMHEYETEIEKLAPFTETEGVKWRKWGAIIMAQATKLSVEVNALAVTLIRDAEKYGNVCLWKVKLETRMTDFHRSISLLPMRLGQAAAVSYHRHI